MGKAHLIFLSARCWHKDFFHEKGLIQNWGRSGSWSEESNFSFSWQEGGYKTYEGAQRWRWLLAREGPDE